MNEHQIPRKHTLTDADLEVLAGMMHCRQCAFSAEEVQFVKSWMSAADTAKSEIIRWLVRLAIFGVGLIALIQVAWKMGYFKAAGGK